MAIRNLSFSPEHGLEAILYIVERLKFPTVHEVLKIRYFSDKLHLSRFGSIGSGDEYVAMKFGPVASNSYNLIKAARGDKSSYINPNFVKVVDGALRVASDGKSMIAERGARLEYLSPAEIECLDDAIKQYGGLHFDHRTEISHDAAWQKAWDSIGDEVGASPMSIRDIASTLDNADEVIGYISA
jgi:uncharacterized phage-associated protein